MDWGLGHQGDIKRTSAVLGEQRVADLTALAIIGEWLCPRHVGDCHIQGVRGPLVGQDSPSKPRVRALEVSNLRRLRAVLPDADPATRSRTLTLVSWSLA